MRIIKFLFVLIIVIILIAVAGGVFFLKTFDVNQYKPQIINEVSKAINRPVTLDKINLGFSLKEGVSLGLSNFAVGDDPAFSKENFLTIQEVQCRVNLQELIKQRKIYISGVNLKAFNLVLIRNKAGELNVQKIKISALAEPSAKNLMPIRLSQGASYSVFDGSIAEAAEGQLPALLVDNMTITDGQVTYRDQGFTPEMVIPVSNLDLTVEKFSLTEPFNFSLDTALWSSERNIRLKGVVRLDATTQTVYLNNLTFSLDAGQCSLKDVGASLSAFPDIQRIEMLKGLLEADLKESAFSPKGILELSLSGQFHKGAVKIKDVSSPVENITIPFKVSAEDLTIDKGTADFAEGKLFLSGSLRDYLKKQQFDFKVTSENINLAKAIPPLAGGIQLEGKLNKQATLQGTSLNPQALHSSSGTGHIDISEGKLSNINVLKVIFDKMSMLPKLNQQFEQNLPDKYKTMLQRTDTPFSAITLDAHIDGGVVIVDKLLAETDAFSISGKGTMDAKMNADFMTAIQIPADLSDSMVKSENMLLYLLDDSKKISFPLKISGPIKDLSYLPDLDYLAQRVIIQKGTEELDKVLNKIFKTEEPQGETPNAPGASPDVAPQEKAPTGPEDTSSRESGSPEKALIQGLLNSLLPKE